MPDQEMTAFISALGDLPPLYIVASSAPAAREWANQNGLDPERCQYVGQAGDSLRDTACPSVVVLTGWQATRTPGQVAAVDLALTASGAQFVNPHLGRLLAPWRPRQRPELRPIQSNWIEER